MINSSHTDITNILIKRTIHVCDFRNRMMGEKTKKKLMQSFWPTRMHSSRMCTDRALAVFLVFLPGVCSGGKCVGGEGGGGAQGGSEVCPGVCDWMGVRVCVYRGCGGHTPPQLWTEWQTPVKTLPSPLCYSMWSVNILRIKDRRFVYMYVCHTLHWMAVGVMSWFFFVIGIFTTFYLHVLSDHQTTKLLTTSVSAQLL